MSNFYSYIINSYHFASKYITIDFALDSKKIITYLSHLMQLLWRNAGSLWLIKKYILDTSIFLFNLLLLPFMILKKTCVFYKIIKDIICGIIKINLILNEINLNYKKIVNYLIIYNA